MAAPVQTGMEKADMKRLLAKAKQEPVYCAMAQSSQPKFGLLLLHKNKQGLPLEKELTSQFKDAKNARFGVAYVDLDEDAKLVKFRINKPVSGMAKRLVKTLKNTGFTKVQIVLDDEAQTAVDEASGGDGDEDDDDDAVPAAPPLAADPALAAAPPPPPAPPLSAAPPPAPAAPAHDAASLTRLLTALAGRIPAAAGSDAARRGQLLQLAGQAQSALKAADLGAAERAITELSRALAAAPPAGAAPGAGTPAQGAVAYAKSRLAWLAARKKMESDIEKLRASIVGTYPDIANDLEKRYQDRVATVLVTLDESLADALDAATNATDPAERGKMVADARGIVQKYQTYVAGESLIADLDNNPFVPLTIGQTMNATLTALAASIR